MSDHTHDQRLLRVATADLAYGLYVSVLDRPWSEVPVMFQGFEICDDDELEILRRHCEHVFVDPERSQEDSIQGLQRQPSAKLSAGSAGLPDRTDLDDVFANARHPSTEAFQGLISRAHERRSVALDFLDDSMRQVRAGENLDTEGAREAVGSLAEVVSRNTTASLWLTNLRDRDEYTTRHAVNVCVLALVFGVHCGFERRDLERMAMGAMLIDVGMTQIPDELIRKPGALTVEEWEIMKTHPQAGVEVVKTAGYVPRETLDIIQLHHERLDGSGYPFGLRGSQIPLHARLAGLFDTYDAMTSPRIYQEATPPDRVLQYLHNEAETSFGVTPVQQFIRCIGVYPVGSLVELDNGAAAVVLGSQPDARVRPTVLLVRTPDGDFYDKRVLLNLAAAPEANRPGARSVRRVLDPVAEDIDVPAIVAFEFGLG